MADGTKISWSDATWNPTVGCSVISPGCTNCYAMRLAARLERIGSPIYRGLTTQTKAGAVWNGTVEQSNWGIRTAPLRWRKPRRIFVDSMSDLFHNTVPDAWIDEGFGVMARCPQHIFQVLTKRSQRMRAYVEALPLRHSACNGDAPLDFIDKWPLPNVWLGVSVEDQMRANERIPDLLATPAAVRFLSCEPLLRPISLRQWCDLPAGDGGTAWQRGAIDWVICGGESGPNARPMHITWARSLRDQCTNSGIPFFFKQWGEWLPEDDAYERSLKAIEAGAAPNGMYRVGKRAAGAMLDGREWRQFPA